MAVSHPPYPPPVPLPLATGAVHARHIVFLYIVIFAVTSIAGGKLARSADPAWQYAWQNFLCQVIAASLASVIALVVPELRRSLPILYAPGRLPLMPLDVALFLALMLTWAYGGSRVFFAYPLLAWKPEWFGILGYQEHYPEVGAAFIFLYAIGSSLFAPFAEELVFRGFLLNLWRSRLGLWPGILLSSLAFGLAHTQFALFATVGGIFFALVYLRFGSLVPGTLLHGFYNLMSAPFIIGPYFLEKPIRNIASPGDWIPELVLTAVFFPLLYLFWRRFRPHR